MSKQSTGGSKIVVDYLVRENRPFSAQDIANNLNGQLGKTAIVNTLEELATQGKIVEKVYGKQKVYMALQNVDCTNIKSELRQLDEKISLSTGDLNRLRSENNRMESELSAHEGKVPMKELERQVAQLTGEVQNLSGRLDALKNSNVKLISKDEKKKIQMENEKYAKQWRKLKRISNEMMAAILENCNVRKNQLCEDLGIVLDEHENVQPPNI